MSKIYQRAICTVSWLGSDEFTQCAADDFVASNFQDWVALAQLLNNEYFTRLWVIQEVLLAKEVRVLCGTAWIMLTDMERCAERMQAMMLSRVRNESLFLLWDRRHNRSNRNLGQCVDRYGSHKCKDPRDKIYALRGILRAHESEMLLVDYKKPAFEVFLDAVGIIALSSNKPPNCLIGAGAFMKSDQVTISLCLGSQMLTSKETTVVAPFFERLGNGYLYVAYDAWVEQVRAALVANQTYIMQNEHKRIEQEEEENVAAGEDDAEGA
jgi:hypothetical protein